MNQCFQIIITVAWCFLTRGTPVYVKKSWRHKKPKQTDGSYYSYNPIIKVKSKVARYLFDPFIDNPELFVRDGVDIIYLKSNGEAHCSGQARDLGQWTYVSVGKRFEMKLKQQ